MSEMSNSQRTSFQDRVFALSEACPFDGCNPSACPLHEIRKKSQRQRHEWAQALSEESVFNILVFHEVCLGKKEDQK